MSKQTKSLTGLSTTSTIAALDYYDKKISKEELNKVLDEAIAKKKKAITKKDGSIDYLKMSEMYHSGNW
jgi:hypothetical protein